MDKTISVIIPVYNVKAYLPQCMDSVLNQSYRALEILLIDDGSTDGSGAMCDEYGAADPRVRVIHQKNGGAAAAKNAGLRVATGEYLAFLDSDDYLEPDAYEYMVNLLEQTGADAVQCSFRNVYVNDSQDIVTLPRRQEFTVTEFLRRYTIDWTCGMMTEKLYRRQLFYGIFFEEGNVIDDDYFTYQGVMNGKKYVRDPKVVYNYRQRKSSVTYRPDYQERTIFDRMEYLAQRKERVSNRYPDLKKTFDLHYLQMLLWMAGEPYATERCMEAIKAAADSYLSDRHSTRPGWALRRQLRQLRKADIAMLMAQRRPRQCEDMSRYYD